MAAVVAPTAASSALPTSSPSRAEWITSSFEGFRNEIDEHNDRRERIIKTSRDVTALSKKLIFLLHRFPIPSDFTSGTTTPSAQAIPPKLLRDAREKINEIATLLLRAGVEERLSASEVNSNRHRYERNIGGGLEEFIEGVSFFHFLTTRRLITPGEVQAYLSVKDSTSGEKRKLTSGKDGVEVEVPDDFVFPIPTSRYLLGISDLTGELMRFATNSLSSTNNSDADPTAVVRLVLDLQRDIYEALTPLTPYVQDLGKKQNVTAQSLRKCEDLMYQLNIRIGEFVARSGGGGSGGAAANDEQQRAVVREMLKRALQQQQAGPPRDDEE